MTICHYSLIEDDEFAKTLWQIYQEVKYEGYVQVRCHEAFKGRSETALLLPIYLLIYLWSSSTFGPLVPYQPKLLTRGKERNPSPPFVLQPMVMHAGDFLFTHSVL
jgi:hypothetical protein